MKPTYTFQKRLEEALLLRNIKPVELHQKTGISESLLSKYLSGSAVARQKKLTLLADALNINEVWLMGYDVSMNRDLKTDKLNNPVVSIPILGEVKAGYNHLAQETWIGTIDVKSDVLTDNTDEYFALEVKGDSMAGAFLEGDTVIVHKQSDCENNDFAIVIINGDEGTLKMVKKTNFGIILQPLNPAYEAIAFTNEEIEKIPVQIAGVVVRLERDLRKLKK